ncbi:hypothetical protein HYDPIDRAFT_171639, partial [Hydnomerulius pinastri MD-312]
MDVDEHSSCVNDGQPLTLDKRSSRNEDIPIDPILLAEEHTLQSLILHPVAVTSESVFKQCADANVNLERTSQRHPTTHPHTQAEAQMAISTQNRQLELVNGQLLGVTDQLHTFKTELSGIKAAQQQAQTVTKAQAEMIDLVSAMIAKLTEDMAGLS